MNIFTWIYRKLLEPTTCSHCGAELTTHGFYDALRCPNRCERKRFEKAMEKK